MDPFIIVQACLLRVTVTSLIENLMRVGSVRERVRTEFEIEAEVKIGRFVMKE